MKGADIDPQECKLEDASAMYEIERDIFPKEEAWFEALFYSILSSQDHKCIKRTGKDGHIEGFLIWKEMKVDKPNIVHVETVDVEKSHHGKGIGSELMRYVEKIVKKPALFKLEVSVKNYPAISMYNKLGYEKSREWRGHLVVNKDGTSIPCPKDDTNCGIIKDYYGRGRNAFMMAKEVPE